MKRFVWSRMMLIIEISGQLETVQHCLSAVMRVWSFMDCVLVKLKISSSSSMHILECLPIPGRLQMLIFWACPYSWRMFYWVGIKTSQRISPPTQSTLVLRPGSSQPQVTRASLDWKTKVVAFNLNKNFVKDLAALEFCRHCLLVKIIIIIIFINFTLFLPAVVI